MPRSARKKSEKQIYHIMLRGNNKENIFIDEEDKSRMIDTLQEKKKLGEYYLYAYCVMDNHLHIIIKEGKDAIDRIVKRIAASYAYYFNKKYKRIGHVFQERYRSENIDDESYLLSAIRYIHQNPIKPGIGTVENYRWSSYRDYMGHGRYLTDKDDILGIISNDQIKAKKEFARFNHEYTDGIFLDLIECKEINESNILDYINEFINKKGIEAGDLRSPAFKAEREEIIKLLLEGSSLSQRGIAVLLGLSREMVRRTVVSLHLSP